MDNQNKKKELIEIKTPRKEWKPVVH